jgi:hypothetical protein
VRDWANDELGPQAAAGAGARRHVPPSAVLTWMAEEREFFAADGTHARADLRVTGHPTVPHDRETELVTLD